MEELLNLCQKALEFVQKKGCSYCDIRAEKISRKIIEIEDGKVKYDYTYTDQGLGIRVFNQRAWGFCSLSNPKTTQEVTEAAEIAVKGSKIGKDSDIQLKEHKSYSEKVNYPVKVIPDENELIQIGIECDKIIRSKKRIIKSNISLSTQNTQKAFLNSENSEIIQNYTDTVATMNATANESGITQSINTTEGGRGGFEKISHEKPITESAEFISDKASKLIYGKVAKREKTTVIMNPDFIGLLTHEILGHPSEADRVLGKEMAWAGGAWWKGKIGQKIGSSNLTVFDDPTIPGTLGHYFFDDEGIKAKKTTLIEKGVLKNHFQSRETAGYFNTEPTANMRATSYKFVPLIRMSCTCIDSGNWKPEEMIKEVNNGYLIVNMKIPSIDFKRYNWSISSQFAQRIENGELTDLIRDVIVMGTAPEFFNSISACGNDLTIRPITNCGKGDPMQIMTMGNGGPSVTATATIESTTK